MDIAALALQESLAKAFIERADPRWEHIVANVEVGPTDDGGLQFDNLAFALVPNDGAYEKANIRLGEAEQIMVRDLRTTMSRSGEAPWGSFELTIDRPAAFRFEFSYDPPKRIAGIFDQESYIRFGAYADEYAARKGKPAR